MHPDDLLAALVGVEREAVALIYFGGLSIADVETRLDLARTGLGAVMAAAYRRVARAALAAPGVGPPPVAPLRAPATV